MLAVGQVINNRYRIHESLGRGGMGSVVKGHDDTLNRFVAVKELRVDPGSSPQVRAQVQQQFLQEAQVLANMHHPGLPRVTDYFTFNGNEYLVMDFVEGRSLGAMLSQTGGQPFEEVQVLGWGRQLLDALAYCHSRGVIHRDIKPQNLVLTPDGRVVLVDFGLAKLYNPNEDQQTKTALRGLGTPEYAPPEQYDSVSGHTDPRSDIYAVGATMYHLLTGQAPPTATQRMYNPASFVLPPSWHTAISPTTQAAVLRALRIPRAERFGSVGEMQTALFPAGTGAYGIGYTPSAGPLSAAPPPARTISVIEGATPPPAAPPATSPEGEPRANSWATYALAALAAMMFLLVTGSALSGLSRVASAAFGGNATPRPTLAVTLTPGTAVAQITASLPPTTPPIFATDTPSPGTSRRVRAADGAPMVYVPGGSFIMGAETDDPDALDNQKPAHVVFLEAFWVDEREVSNEQFSQFVEETRYITDAELAGLARVWIEGAWLDTTGAYWREPYGPGSGIDALDMHPVVAMTWNDSRAYCDWAGGRLLSEAEWEKAARGTLGELWPWGKDWDSTRLNYCDASCPDQWRDQATDDSFSLTAPVDSFASGASPYGALNMSGNVIEWVGDWYDRQYYSVSPSRDPQGPETGTQKVLRGGSWFAPPERARTTYRAAFPADTPLGNAGFRCAMDP